MTPEAQNASTGATNHQATMRPITAQSIRPVATPRPAMAPTAVIEVEAGTPTRFDMNSANPMKNNTAIDTVMEKRSAGTISPPIVSTTFRPTVHPPSSAKPVISPAAPIFEMVSLPTAGPKATPVEEPPMLNPTNTATRMPTRRSAPITSLRYEASSFKWYCPRWRRCLEVGAGSFQAPDPSSP
jgi:hypothetical protein